MTGSGRVGAAHLLVHNLKTPLTGIIGLLEMMLDGDLGDVTPQQRDALRLSHDQALELLGMIDELLDVARLQEVPSARRERLDVSTLARELGAEWAHRLGGRLTTDVADGVETVWADRVLLRRVLGNLLLNASVHGGAGVSAALRVERGDADSIRITVADDGPGIPAGMEDEVFEAFVRMGDGAQAWRSSGLGLTYCREAVRAMGGRYSSARRDSA